MSNKITNINEGSAAPEPRVPSGLPSISLGDYSPVDYTINTYTVNRNSSSTSNGESATCDGNNYIQCDIRLAPGAKFKSITSATLVLRNKGGDAESFAVYKALVGGGHAGEPFAYLENRLSNGSIAYRAVDITNLISGCKTQTFSIAIDKADRTSTDSCSVYTANATLELTFLEDDDFIPGVSKIEGTVGSKGAYSVNVRNGKMFYAQKLIQAKGGRMPLGLTLTYNAADCDNNRPNEFATGIKGWTFNYAQIVKPSTGDYTLLDGAHKYRTFKASVNNSAIKYDASGKNGAFLVQNGEEFEISDGKNTTYNYDTLGRLTRITYAGGSTPMITSVTYNSDGKIATITDGMSDVYTFTYTGNMIMVSCGFSDYVMITLENERVKEIMYLMPGETYSFTYNDNGELLTVADSASNDKAVFAYDNSCAVTAIKKYVRKNAVDTPISAHFLEYAVLETKVFLCRNTDSKSSAYSTTLYRFAENGETIFASEYGSLGAFKNMRFRTKGDYEKYVADLIDIANAERNKATFTFNSQSACLLTTNLLSGSASAQSGTVQFNTSNYKSDRFIFSAKAVINADSYDGEDEQTVLVDLKEGSTILATLKFDPRKRDYQVQGTMLKLSRGAHTLSACARVNNMHAAVYFTEVCLFETNSSKQTEYVGVYVNNGYNVETDNENTTWYVNNGGFTLSAGNLQKTGVKFTTKDYILTTLSRFKNPDSFNVWYNDGENMLAQVSSAYLSKGGVTQSITSVRCCSITEGIEKTVFSDLRLGNGVLKAINTTRTYQESEDEDGNIYEDPVFFTAYTSYNANLKPVEVKNEDGVITQYTYNSDGEVLTEKTFPGTNSSMYTLASRAYSGGNLASVTEKRNGTSYSHSFAYNYDDTISYETTPAGQQINHVYSADGDKLMCLSTTIDGNENMNVINYAGDIINSFEHNNTAITFEYDERNSIDNIKLAGNSIVSKEITYGAQSTQSVTTYGNGDKIKKYFDKYNRLIRVTDVTSAETEICAYLYSDYEVEDDTITSPEDNSLARTAASKLRVVIDSVAGTRTKYIYDEYGNLKEKLTGTVSEKINDRDKFNRPTSYRFSDGSSAALHNIYYENDYSNEIAREAVQTSTGYTGVQYSRDALKRLTSVKTTHGTNGYSRDFTYAPRGTASSEGTTGYIQKVTYHNIVNDVATLEKTENIAYNADGNIITCGENTYVYDNLGRLIRENNKALDKTFLFMYNVGGNLVSKTEYAYTTGAVGTATKTYNYTYGNGWKDQLTAFDGKSITYDGGGNPTSYLGATMAWGRGRLLKSYTPETATYSVAMQYDVNGFRKSKIKDYASASIATATTSYVYDSEGRLRFEYSGSFNRTYIYTSDGIAGYDENGTRFLYRKNLFGDITAIYQGATKVAEYVYDAWGNCAITLNTNGYGTRNPFRYRGYYFDNDLGMYYLLTRYYDPKTGRFINADSPEYLDPKTLGGLNLYAYCNNNPIMCVDPTGHEPMSAAVATLLLFTIYTVLIGGMWLYLKLTGEPEPEPEPSYSIGQFFKDFFDALGKAFGWWFNNIPIVIVIKELSTMVERVYCTPDQISDMTDPSLPTYQPKMYPGYDPSGGGTFPYDSGYDLFDENGWQIK